MLRGYARIGTAPTPIGANARRRGLCTFSTALAIRVKSAAGEGLQKAVNVVPFNTLSTLPRPGPNPALIAEERWPPANTKRRQPMASETSEHTVLDAWPRAVMATLFLLITLITLHLVQLSWFDDATASRAAPAADLAQHR